jgi:hypothetical protein
MILGHHGGELPLLQAALASAGSASGSGDGHAVTTTSAGAAPLFLIDESASQENERSNTA